MVRDVGVAEDLAQDALVEALEQWPRVGRAGATGRLADGHREAPRDRPAARARCISASRTRSVHEDRGPARRASTPDARPGTRRRRRRRPAAPHLHLPAIRCCPTEARVALTLRLLGGLTTDEIARAFLVAEPTVAQRIVRAKRTLAEAQVPFEVPRGAELADAPRVGARGDLPDLQRGLLGHRRRRLDAARRCARRRCGWDASSPGSRPEEPEVHGLVGLMEIQASRIAGAVGPSGEPMLLLDQDRCALGSAADPPRARCARARRIARRRAESLHAAGRDRRVPRARPHRGGDRLDSGSSRSTRRWVA